MNDPNCRSLNYRSAPNCRSLCSLHLEVVELARLRARNELGPMHRDTHQRGRSVEGATFFEAQCAAVTLGDLTRRVDGNTIARALLDEVERVWRRFVRGAMRHRVGGTIKNAQPRRTDPLMVPE